MTLAEIILAGFECDPAPITAADFTDILRDDMPDIHVGEVNSALLALVASGKIEMDVMYCQKRKCTVNHYFSKEWDGAHK